MYKCFRVSDPYIVRNISPLYVHVLIYQPLS